MNFRHFTLSAKIASYLGMWTLAGIVLFPILWLTLNVAKSSDAIIGRPFDLPKSFSVQHIVVAWNQGDFTTLYTNSVIITVVSVLGILLVEGFAAYAFARMRFRGRAAMFALFLAGQLVPAQVIVLPSALEMARFGLSD